MDINNPFYIEILQALSKANARYVLVGGLAVSYHGYARYTGDMDLWVEPERENVDRLYSALVDIGYPEEVVDEIRKERNIDNPTPIKLNDDDNRLKIDLMTYIFYSELSWQDCYNNAEIMNLEQLDVPVVNIDHLIEMKENTRRIDDSLKDLVDAQELKKIKKLKQDN